MTTSEPRRSDIGIPVTDDQFLGESLSIFQPRKGYRAGIDAVLLAATVEADSQQAINVLDLGAGVGVVGLAVATRLPRAHVTLIENHPDLLALAQQNVDRNGVSDRVTVQAKDIVQDGSQDLAAGRFDFALANPPFYEPSTVRRSPNSIKADAHVMPSAALERWFRLMAHALKPGGIMTVIHRVEALPELLQLASGRFGKLEIQPIHPFAGELANRIIVRGRKGSRQPVTILPGLVIHQPDRSYRAEIEEVLRSPTGLRLDRS